MKPCKRCVLTVARSNRAFAAFSAGDRSGFKVFMNALSDIKDSLLLDTLALAPIPRTRL